MEMSRIKMKRKNIILGLLAALCLLGTGSYAWILHEEYNEQVAVWKEEAKASFEEALWMEVNKRSEIPFFSISSGEHGMTTLNTKIPDSVHVTSALGRRGYRIEPYKYENSLIKETKRRGDLGILLEEFSLSVDTLFIYWDSLLSLKDIHSDNQIRYVYTDLELQNDTTYSKKGNQLDCEDSLTVKYLGFRCEHELIAYSSYSHWLLGLSLLDWSWLSLPWIVLILVIVYYVHLERFFRRKFIKEREVHVADVKIEKAQTFLLPDGSVFDSLESKLTKDGQEYKLSNQSSILLKLFLRKESHRLSPADIDQELWNGKGTADQLYKAIQRLRVGLKKVTSELEIKNENGNYELK